MPHLLSLPLREPDGVTESKGLFQLQAPPLTLYFFAANWSRMVCRVQLTGKTYAAPCKHRHGSMEGGQSRACCCCTLALTPRAPCAGGGEGPRESGLPGKTQRFSESRMQHLQGCRGASALLLWSVNLISLLMPGSMKQTQNGLKYQINFVLFIYHKTYDLDVLLVFHSQLIKTIYILAPQGQCAGNLTS